MSTRRCDTYVSIVLAPARLLLRTARIVRRRPIFGVLAFLVFLVGIGMFAPMPAGADFGEDPGPPPTGFGDLLQGPPLWEGNERTLYEAVPSGAYVFDTNRLGPNDWYHKVLNGIASAIMQITAALVRGAIVMVWTMFDSDTLSSLASGITSNLGATASELLVWMLPTALAIGAVAAYAKGRGTQGGGFGQIMWVFVGGLIAVSFALGPAVWVNNLTNARNIASEGVLAAASTSVATTDTPFQWEPEATFNDEASTDAMLRTSADAIWRSYVVTPWCYANFGSAASCERYGAGILSLGTDTDARSDWIQDSSEGHPNEYDDASPFYMWIAGKNSYERLAMALFALFVAAVFALLIIFVAFASQLAFISALLLLFAGVVFAMLWCIPGRPREWGNRWLETVIGLMLQSVIAALILAAALVLTSAAFQLAGTHGWGIAAFLAVAISFAAFGLRRTLGTIMGAMTPGGGMTAMIGALAIRSGARMAGRATGGAARAMGRGASTTARAGARTTAAAARAGGRVATAGGRRLRGFKDYSRRTPRDAAPASAAAGASTRPPRTTERSSTAPGGSRRPPGTPTPGRSGRTPAGGRSRKVGSPRLRENPPPPRRTAVAPAAGARTAPPAPTSRTSGAGSVAATSRGRSAPVSSAPARSAAPAARSRRLPEPREVRPRRLAPTGRARQVRSGVARPNPPAQRSQRRRRMR